MAKKEITPLEKKEIVPLEKKVYNLNDYKSENKLNDGVGDKPLEFIPTSTAFQKTTGLSIPKGSITLFRGLSNTGKSTALYETIIGCQRISKTLPIIIDLENSLKWEHLYNMGFEFTQDVNDETGELGDPKGFFIYINNDYLIENFGRLKDKNRDEAVIEDLARFIDKTLDDQTSGKLPYDLCFCIDSIGVLDCEQSVVSKSRNQMWNAAAYSASFRSIANYRIPASTKLNKPYTNTIVAVNKIWINNMLMGQGIVEHSGGGALKFASRLIFHFGGVQSAGTKILIATANKRDYVYGVQTKVSVEKNHINGNSYKGTLISTSHGFFLPEEMEEYKKKYKNFMLDKLGFDSNENIDLTFTEEEGLTEE